MAKLAPCDEQGPEQKPYCPDRPVENFGQEAAAQTQCASPQINIPHSALAVTPRWRAIKFAIRRGNLHTSRCANIRCARWRCRWRSHDYCRTTSNNNPITPRLMITQTHIIVTRVRV